MSAPMKRTCETDPLQNDGKLSTSALQSENLSKFVSWCSENNFNVNCKVGVLG